MWFAPEIYYNADRLMAGRHAYFFAAFHDVEGEQRRELAKVVRSDPKIVFANRSNYRATATAFPAVVEFLELNYSTAASFDEDGDHYSILISRHTAPLRDDPGTGWPCFTTRTPPTEPLRIADR